MNKIDNDVIEIDLDNCTSCKACVNDCVYQLFYIEGNKLQIVDDFVDRCIICGHCVAVCPVNVVKLKIHEGKHIKELIELKEIPDYNSFYNLVITRRSIRQFQNKPVSKELIQKLLEITRYSPTGRNTENVYFTIIQNKKTVANISNYITIKVKRFVEGMENPKDREKFKERMPIQEFDIAIKELANNKAILKIIGGGIDFWCYNGELIFIHGDHNINDVSTNSALAAAHIMLAAEILGLGACSLGYLTYYANQSETIKKLINLPENHEVGYSLTIGYPKIKYKRVPIRKQLRVKWL